jgi:hypothetical protein
MQAVRLNEIHEAHKDDVEFFLIYIREAHPPDGWQTSQNLYEEVIYTKPVTVDERAEIAGTCQIALDLKLPLFIDNATEEKYVAEPIRLYVVDGDGILTFNGAPGPAGYDLDAWEDAIKATLAAAG